MSDRLDEAQELMRFEDEKRAIALALIDIAHSLRDIQKDLHDIWDTDTDV